MGVTRQGYIGKEKDIENSLGDHGVRKYDYESGRFNSIDPLWEKYYGWTPYQYCGNNPIWTKDWNGKYFNINSHTPEYMKKDAPGYINQSIQYFEENGDAEAAKFIRDMRDDPDNEYQLKIDKNGGTQFNPVPNGNIDQSITHWNPFMALIVNSSGDAQSPALQFLHELKHAKGFKDAFNNKSSDYDDRVRETDSNMKNKEEKRVIDDTNGIAKKIGEPIRNSYNNVQEKRVKSPTSR